MQNSHPPKLIYKLLVLLTVIGLAVVGWLTGHILRHAVPELQHPPIRLPGEEVGKVRMQFLDNPRFNSVPSGEPRLYVFTEKLNFSPSFECRNNTYYTSLPAKCQSVDGHLVRVGGGPQEMHIIPYGTWEKGPSFPFPIPTP